MSQSDPTFPDTATPITYTRRMDDGDSKQYEDSFDISYVTKAPAGPGKMLTLKEEESLDVDFTMLSNIDSYENMAIEEYRTNKGKLVMKQAGNEWKSRIWINIYIELNDEWILMYLDNSCTINALIIFLKGSKELDDAEKIFDDDNVKVYRGDDDGKLCGKEEDVLLTEYDIIGRLNTVNIYIKSKCMKIDDNIDEEKMSISNLPSFTMPTNSTRSPGTIMDGNDLENANILSPSETQLISRELSREESTPDKKNKKTSCCCDCIVL